MSSQQVLEMAAAVTAPAAAKKVACGLVHVPLLQVSAAGARQTVKPIFPRTFGVELQYRF